MLLGLLVLPLYAIAQRADSPVRIATLSDGEEEGSAHLWALFRKRLAEFGVSHNVRYTIESSFARGDSQRLHPLAARLVELKPAVIVADGTSSALAAKKSTASIPIVAIRISDPVKSGLAESLSRPGQNLTGTSIITADIAGEWVELLREVTPGLKSLGFLNDTSNPGAMLTFRELQQRAQSLGVSAQVLDGRNAASVDKAFSTMASERIGGLVVGTNAVVFGHRQRIVEAAARQRIPGIYARSEYVEAGGLMSYGADLGAHYSHAADYVHRIVRGAKPGDLPMEQPIKLELVVNMKAAKALGITVPQSVLVRTDRVIE